MIMNQATLDVNQYELYEVRLSCIYFMPALGPLRTRNVPAIPCAFLLDDGGFTGEYARSATETARFPWLNQYARLFWKLYAPQMQPDDLRRALAPIEYDLSSIVSSLTLEGGAAVAKALLYPWGVGMLIDITMKPAMGLALNAAVDRLIAIRNRANIAWKMGTDSGMASPGGVAAEIWKRLAPALYGASAPQEPAGEQFSIVTVVDATDLVVTDAIPAGGPIHHALEGMTGWKQQWKNIQPDANSLTTYRIPSATAPVGHILYGKTRTRAVWFPGNFRRVAAYGDTLACFHQNLSTATLHTEALCVLIDDAAAQLTAHGSLIDCSLAYRNCTQLAAGLLGRLHGKKTDETKGTKPATYRSGSVRAQILDHKDNVNQVRIAVLASKTALDA